jgi:hypothetical protein
VDRESDWPLTPEIEWRLMKEHQDFLSTEYAKVRYIMTQQERELAFLSLAILGLCLLVMRQGRYVQFLMEKEGPNNELA